MSKFVRTKSAKCADLHINIRNVTMLESYQNFTRVYFNVPFWGLLVQPPTSP